ncbi:MAG: gliding motility-associated C-terminal domain-containing protein [Bacteroidetes bacterium]|nr:gliding motility-associated C-terminal domain-containing protein [Bacteroidota bacterium]
MKRLLMVTLLLFFVFEGIAQRPTFLKALHQFNYSQQVRVIPSNDGGWLLFTLDSCKIYKFNSCGIFQWTQKYSFSGLSIHGIDLIPTNSGGFAFLVRCSPGSNYYPIMVNADAQGNVIWCKSFSDPLYGEAPYTLIQDHSGNFFTYGNATLLATNEVFNTLSKISNSGNIIWSKLYNHGGIWGGAILTKDNGFLMRTGNIFIKTDINGNELWTSKILDGMYHYYKPVEVDDGFIFNGYTNGIGSTDTVCFYKIDKLGNMLWGGKRQLDFIGVPMQLTSKYNGNFIFLHPKQVNGKSYQTITEFDKDLNVINQTAIENNAFNISYNFSSACFLKDSSAVIGGAITINDPAVISRLAFLKADINQHFSCDTGLVVNSTNVPLVQNSLTTSVTSRSYTSNNQFLISETRIDSTYFICSSFSPLQVNLGGDTSLCAGSSIALQNKSNAEFDLFVWSTGETAAQIIVSQPGKYWLRASNSCRQESVSDTILVDFKFFPKPSLLRDTSICSENGIELNAFIPGASYMWSEGSSSANITINQPGNYVVNINYLNCSKSFETKVEDCEILLLPNVITPNNDGFNNAFLPIEMRGIIDAQLKVFNRWGQEIYYTTDIINRPWAGNAYSKKCPDGVYYWIVEYTNYLHVNKLQKGSVSLFSE